MSIQAGARWWAVALCGWIAAVTSAQSNEQARLSAQRAAEADAFRQLTEVVYGLRVNQSALVRDFANESDALRTEVDHFIRGVRFGPPRFHDDGSCEVPAEAPVSAVVEALRAAHAKYEGSEVTAEDVNSVAKRLDREVIRVVGRGIARTDLPPGLPPGARERLRSEVRGDAANPPVGAGVQAEMGAIPGIWRRIGPRARLGAIEAARRDAQRRLTERIMGLRLTSQATAPELSADENGVGVESSGLVAGAREVSTFLRHDELIAEVTLRIPAAQVDAAMRRVAEGAGVHRLGAGGGAEPAFAERDLEATGMGVPSAELLREAAPAALPQAPEWVAATLEAHGEAAPESLRTAQDKLKGSRTAESAAKRALIDKIRALGLDGAGDVGSLLDRNRPLAIRIEALVDEASVELVRIDASGVRVTVSVPGMAVWGILNDSPQDGR